MNKNMLKSKLYILVLFIIFQSCKNETQVIEEQLIKCVNKSTNFTEYNPIGKGDFYTMIKEIEDLFISNKKLNDSSKKSYQDMILSVLSNENSDENFYHNIYKIYDKYGYLPSVNNYRVFNECPFQVLVTEKHDMKSTLFYQSQALSGIQADGYRDVNLIKELISLTSENDFTKIVYRAPILLVCVSSLDNIYGEAHAPVENFNFSKSK